MPVSDNITWHAATTNTEQREESIGNRGCLLWFTGLSGSGKSTIARALETRLLSERRIAYVLDGDNIRHGLNADLGFSPEDRAENIRRVTEVSSLFVDAGIITISAFISPYRADRNAARTKLPTGRFLEVHVATPIEVCEARDPKGLYQKVRKGEIRQFTGIDAPYEVPINPEVILDTENNNVDSCVDILMLSLKTRGLLPTSAVD